MIKRIKKFQLNSIAIILTMLLAVAGISVGCTSLNASPDNGSQTGQSENQSSDTDETSTTESAETTPVVTPDPTPEPTLPPEPALPADPLVESWFGPLPVPQQTAELKRNEIRALYIGAASNIDATLDIIKNTEVNAVVIDLKESDGIKYDSKVPLAIEIGEVKPAYNIEKVLDTFHQEGVKVIGRIVCFKDPQLAEAKPEMAIRDKNGSLLYFSLENGKPFASPYNQDVWQYYIDMAIEAIELGVDEIQFDYVRFPTGSTKSGQPPYFGAEGEVPSKIQAINRFLQTAAIAIQTERGIPLGADVFGIILGSKLDGERIGQDWQTIGLTGIDNLSPMIYPSHYANSSTNHYTGNGEGTNLNGRHFEKPDLEPYEVMYQALMLGLEATEQERYAVNRPYLQAFTAGYLPAGYYMEYGADEISAQIKAIEDAGFKEWICWNPFGQYPGAAFKTEQ
jgi:hypothetical protein